MAAMCLLVRYLPNVLGQFCSMALLQNINSEPNVIPNLKYLLGTSYH